MKVLFDTNVVLDVLLRRQPFHETAVALFARVELGRLEGFLGATTVTTLAYFMEKELGQGARLEVQRLLLLFNVAAVDQGVLRRAARSPLADYEDAVLVEAAQRSGLDAIVTRNTKDFKDAPLSIFTPAALLAVLEARQT